MCTYVNRMCMLRYFRSFHLAVACEMRWVLLHCIYIEQQHMTFWLMSYVRLWILMGMECKMILFFLLISDFLFPRKCAGFRNGDALPSHIAIHQQKLCDRDGANEHGEWVGGGWMKRTEAKRFYCYFYLTHAFRSHVQIYIKIERWIWRMRQWMKCK